MRKKEVKHVRALDDCCRLNRWRHSEAADARTRSGRHYRNHIAGYWRVRRAGLLGRAVGWYGEGEPVGFIASVLGAIILLAIYRVIVGRGARGGGIRRAA